MWSLHVRVSYLEIVGDYKDVETAPRQLALLSLQCTSNTTVVFFE